MTRIVATLAVVTLLQAGAAAQDSGLDNWENLARLKAGQRVEVEKKNGDRLSGAFASSAGESLSLRLKKQDLAVPRAEVRLVRRSGLSRNAVLIGLAAGAGGGAIAGVVIAQTASNGSGGDFASLKPVVVAVTAGLGALIGLVVGSLAGNRHTTIYKAR